MSDDLQIAGIMLWSPRDLEQRYPVAWHAIPMDIFSVARNSRGDELLFQARTKNQVFDDFEDLALETKN
jgi:hypothetical protein